MDAEPILETIAEYGCRFVVIGSTARRLLGEAAVPADLDIIVGNAAADRPRLVDALIELRATVGSSGRGTRLARTTSLPWEWGWRAMCPFGEIDVIARFVDGTSLDDFDAQATEVRLASGATVRCTPTRHAP